MAWPGKRKGATESSPVNGECQSEPSQSKWWEKRAIAWIGALATLTALFTLAYGSVYGKATSDGNKATKADVVAAHATIAAVEKAASLRMQEQAKSDDARMDLLEQDRAATSARLRNIDEKIDRIELKLDDLRAQRR